MDYGVPERRKNRNDKRAKTRFNRYKQGGQHRVDNIDTHGNAAQKVNK